MAEKWTVFVNSIHHCPMMSTGDDEHGLEANTKPDITCEAYMEPSRGPRSGPCLSTVFIIVF